MYIRVHVCKVTAAVLTKKKKKKATKFFIRPKWISQELYQIWKSFDFPGRIRIWGLHSPGSGLEWKQLCWANNSGSTRAGDSTWLKGLFCRVKFSTAMTRAAWSVPKNPAAPAALRWLPAHTAIHTMPGNSLGSTESHQWQSEPFQRTVHGVGEAAPEEMLCLTLLSGEPPQGLCQLQCTF